MSCQKRKRDRARLRDTEIDIALVKAIVGVTVRASQGMETRWEILRVEAAATEAGNIDICTNFVVT